MEARHQNRTEQNQHQRIPLLTFADSLEAIRQRTSDIIDSFELSLIDSYSMKRQKTPLRGFVCTHNDTFDLTTYNAHNYGKINFECPVCFEPTPTSALRHDELVLRLLSAMPNSDTVKVYPKTLEYQSSPDQELKMPHDLCRIIEILDSGDENQDQVIDDDVSIIISPSTENRTQSSTTVSKLRFLPIVPVHNAFLNLRFRPNVNLSGDTASDLVLPTGTVIKFHNTQLCSTA